MDQINSFASKSRTNGKGIEEIKGEGHRESDFNVDNQESATITISEEGINSYKNSIVDRNNGLKKDVIKNDYRQLLASHITSNYTEKRDDGEYERTYGSIKDEANDLLKAYARMYDEIVRGHNDGTREVYIEDKEVDEGYRQLTLDEEITELNKAYREQSEKFENRYAENKKFIELLQEHQEKLADVSSKKRTVASEAIGEIEKFRNEKVPPNIKDLMLKASESFTKSYTTGNSIVLEDLLTNISVF